MAPSITVSSVLIFFPRSSRAPSVRKVTRVLQLAFTRASQSAKLTSAGSCSHRRIVSQFSYPPSVLACPDLSVAASEATSMQADRCWTCSCSPSGLKCRVAPPEHKVACFPDPALGCSTSKAQGCLFPFQGTRLLELKAQGCMFSLTRHKVA